MKVIPLTIGAWNVRTLMDSSSSDRPGRRTALVGRELDRYKVEITAVDKFTYLGSTLSRAVHIDDEVNARIAKASAAFGRLRGSIWDRSGIRLYTKLKVYRSVVLPTLLHACETWTVYQRHAKRMNHFHTSCLRKLLKIKRQDKIPDTEVLKRAGMQSIHTFLKLAQLRWTGHVTRMPDEHLPKKILSGELQVGKRSHGGQKKRCKDTLKAFLKDFNIPTESWEQIAQDRTKWRGLIRRGAGEYEAKRITKPSRNVESGSFRPCFWGGSFRPY